MISTYKSLNNANNERKRSSRFSRGKDETKGKFITRFHQSLFVDCLRVQKSEMGSKEKEEEGEEEVKRKDKAKTSGRHCLFHSRVSSFFHSPLLLLLLQSIEPARSLTPGDLLSIPSLRVVHSSLPISSPFLFYVLTCPRSD